MGVIRHLLRRVCIFGVEAFALGALAAQADAADWQTIGPTGGSILFLAVDPKTPATVYAGTLGGVFKSLNHGGTWLPLGGFGQVLIFWVAIDPTTPSTIYAGTKNFGLFKSVNGGISWIQANTNLTAKRVFSIVIDPTATTTMYASTEVGVFKSTDGAATWQPTGGSLGSQPVFVLGIDPAAPSTLYAGTKSDGVFKSSDGGATWTASSSGLTQKMILCLAVDPKTPTTLYAGTGAGLFKTTDGAATWTATGNLNLTFETLAIDPTTPSTIYAGFAGGGGIGRSPDGGQSWLTLAAGLPPYCGDCYVDALAIDPTNPTAVYAGTQDGVFASTNSGAAWVPANAGLAAWSVFALAADPAQPAIVYAATQTGAFKSTNAGTTWEKLDLDTGSVGGEVPVYCLLMLPGSPSTILAGLDDGTFRSTDAGVTWTRVLESQTTQALAVTPGVPSTVYAGGIAGGPLGTTGAVAQSTDGGSTWSSYGVATSPLPIVDSLAVGSVSPNVVYAGTDTGIYAAILNKHGVLQWDTNGALSNLSVLTLAFDPNVPTTLYAGTFMGGLLRSTDSGMSWAPSMNGIYAPRIYTLLLDASLSPPFWAGTNAGVFISGDGGASWTNASGGLTAPWVFALAPGPGPGGMYAGTWSRGVYSLVTASADPAPVKPSHRPGRKTRYLNFRE